MSELYRHSRAGITGDIITAEDAAKLLEHVKTQPDGERYGDLWGDLDDGFHFWTTDGHGLFLVWHHVRPVHVERVRLRVWGVTQVHVTRAERFARRSPDAVGWEIVEVSESVEPRCPIARRDPVALAQGNGVRQMWAVYPLSGASFPSP